MNPAHLAVQLEILEKYTQAALDELSARLAILEDKQATSATVEEMTAIVAAAVAQ